MAWVRPAYALQPTAFGRRPSVAAQAVDAPSSLADDLRLFATTFAAGFLFVSILLA